MIQAHVDAFTALLVAAGITFFVGETPNLTSGSYLVVWPDAGGFDGNDLTNGSVEATATFTCHGLGGSWWQANNAMDRTRAAVLDRVPQVDGRRCWPIRQLSGGRDPRMAVDDPQIWTLPAEFRFRSVPA